MLVRPLLLAVSGLALTACESLSRDGASYGPPPPDVPAAYEAIEYTGTGSAWRNQAQGELAERLNAQPNTNRAKNVIVFIADGMSLGTITAARIYDGQSRGESGEQNYLPFERWGNAATIKTYSDNAQVPDSAATATAIHTGVKTHSGGISVYARQTLETCARDADLPETLLESAEDRGLATGIVSTARLTHATPATTYAHVPDRGWETFGAMPAEAQAAGCRDIASQLVEFDRGNGIELALGGGAGAFLPEDQGGRRSDGRDLTAEWEARGGVFAATRDQLMAQADGDRPVLGLFTPSHLSYELDRDPRKEPSLEEMTAFAIERLDDNENGYFLMVEGGRVDHAHHGTNAHRALTDALAFARAVETAADMTDPDETLILVTADHGHVFSIAGYARRGNPILGLVHPPAPDLSDAPTPPSPARDGRPYTSVGYYNGPHQRPAEGALTQDEVLDPDYRQESAVPMGSETHSAEDVAAFARGPWAHLVDGTMEQNTLNRIITFALGWEGNTAPEPGE